MKLEYLVQIGFDSFLGFRTVRLNFWKSNQFFKPEEIFETMSGLRYVIGTDEKEKHESWLLKTTGWEFAKIQSGDCSCNTE